MESNNKAFSIRYSGAINDELEQLKEKYTQKEANKKIKRIRALDKRVDFIATMISIFLGIGSVAFTAINVICVIKDFIPIPVGVLLCVIGIVAISAVPLLHGRIYSSVKEYYSPEILTLIEEIEKNQF